MNIISGLGRQDLGMSLPHLNYITPLISLSIEKFHNSTKINPNLTKYSDFFMYIYKRKNKI